MTLRRSCWRWRSVDGSLPREKTKLLGILAPVIWSTFANAACCFLSVVAGIRGPRPRFFPGPDLGWRMAAQLEEHRGRSCSDPRNTQHQPPPAPPPKKKNVLFTVGMGEEEEGYKGTGGADLEQEVVEDDLLDVAADEPRRQRWPRSVGG